jgi:hypothetical protein
MPWSIKKPAAADIAPDWLKPYCKQFLQKLADQGYAAATMRTYNGAAALFCQEIARRRVRSGQLVGATLTKARTAALGRMHPNKYDQKKYCLERFIDALVEAGVAQRPTPPRKTPTALERLRAEYEAYLREQRGLTEATIYHCVRFLFWSGKTKRDLAASMPRVASAKASHLSRSLKPDEIEQLIDAVWAPTAVGRRNHPWAGYRRHNYYHDGGCGRDRHHRRHLCDRQGHADGDGDNDDPSDAAMACPLCGPFCQPIVRGHLSWRPRRCFAPFVPSNSIVISTGSPSPS